MFNPAPGSAFAAIGSALPETLEVADGPKGRGFDVGKLKMELDGRGGTAAMFCSKSLQLGTDTFIKNEFSAHARHAKHHVYALTQV